MLYKLYNAAWELQMKLEKLFSHYGPGGRGCSCCGPAPHARKQHDRMVKRRMKQAFLRDIKNTLIDKE